MKKKLKLIIILSVEFIVILAILLLIFLAGKKSYTVRFELNGGTLISGNVEQRVTRGKDASPPTVTRDGCYFLKWSTSYKEITKDLVIEAVWEYETTEGITYTNSSNSNYCEISGSYPEIGGTVYIGAYQANKKVLGIQNGAFENRTRITGVYLLDGILSIGDNAFAGCTNLETIVLPSTIIHIGENAFKDCVNLKNVLYTDMLEGMTKEDMADYFEKSAAVLPDGLERIEDNAFGGCTSFEKIFIPETVVMMGSNVFDVIENTDGGEGDQTDEKQRTIYVYTLTEPPITWQEDWYADVENVVWGYGEDKEEKKDEN